MGLLNTLVNLPGAGLVKGAVGGVDEGLGGLVNGIGGAVGAPNAGGALVTQGKSITNPTVNYLGRPNPTPAPAVNKTQAGTTAPTNAPAATVAAPNGATTTTGPTAQDIAAYNLYTGEANTALGRNDTSLASQDSAINGGFQTQQDALTSALNAATTNHAATTTQDQQNRLTAENQINQNGASQYQSLLRILGGLGAGGGSEAQFLVPKLVGDQTSQQLGGAGQNFAQNERANDTNYGTYLTGEKNDQNTLNNQKGSQLATAQAVHDQNKSSLLQILSALKAQSAPAADLATQLSSAETGIPNPSNFTPNFTGPTTPYVAPSLASYEATQGPAAQVVPTASTGTSLTPTLDLLTGQQKKQTNPVG